MGAPSFLSPAVRQDGSGGMGEAGVQHLSSGLWEERAGQCCPFAGASTGLTPALAPVLRLVSSCCPEHPVPSCLHRSPISPTVSHQGLPCCCPRTLEGWEPASTPFLPCHFPSPSILVSPKMQSCLITPRKHSSRRVSSSQRPQTSATLPLGCPVHSHAEVGRLPCSRRPTRI